MSLQTVSVKRKRIYQRKFDHEEAQARFAAGETLSALAHEYGVSPTAVLRIVNPWQRQAMQARANQYNRSGTCVVCGKEGITPANRSYRHQGRCRDCANAAQATSVRPNRLRCVTCERWLPDDHFWRNRSDPRRRGRHSQCKECGTAARSAYRDRHKMPCAKCGRPTSGPRSEVGYAHERLHDWVLCHHCYPRGGKMATDATFVVLVEEEKGLWREQAQVPAKDKRDALTLAFNGEIPDARVAVVSVQAFKAGRVVPVQIYDLEFDAK